MGCFQELNWCEIGASAGGSHQNVWRKSHELVARKESWAQRFDTLELQVSKWRIKVGGLKNPWITSPTSSNFVAYERPYPICWRRIGISGLPQHWPPAWRYQRASQLAPWQNGSTGAMETVKRKWCFKNLSITHPQLMHLREGQWTHFSCFLASCQPIRDDEVPTKKTLVEPSRAYETKPRVTGNPFPVKIFPPNLGHRTGPLRQI